MYSKLPNLIIGFHGCDRSTFELVLHEGNPMISSNNSYDWLGNGIYFWENNYQRALLWAEENAKRKDSKIKIPSVIGAVIDMGHCLNLTDNKSIDIVKNGHALLKFNSETLGIELPENKNINGNTDLLLRHLDCAVIERIHAYNKEINNKPYDSVRGVFVEGGEIYPTAGFREKTHIQICIVNPNCIKGYFNPLSPNEKHDMP